MIVRLRPVARRERRRRRSLIAVAIPSPRSPSRSSRHPRFRNPPGTARPDRTQRRPVHRGGPRRSRSSATSPISSLGAPPGMAPQALPDRRGASARSATEAGGACVRRPDEARGLLSTCSSTVFGACRPSRTPPAGSMRQARRRRNSFALGLYVAGIREGRRDAPHDPCRRRRAASDVQIDRVEHEYGSTTPIRFVYVSHPIDAAFNSSTPSLARARTGLGHGCAP